MRIFFSGHENKGKKEWGFEGKLCMSREVRKAMEDSQPKATSEPDSESTVPSLCIIIVGKQ